MVALVALNVSMVAYLVEQVSMVALVAFVLH